MAFDDGGPAFPKAPSTPSAGMSLRDYFAAAAMQGLLSQHLELIKDKRSIYEDYACHPRYSPEGLSYELVGFDAYEIADAMLETRRITSTPPAPESS